MHKRCQENIDIENTSGNILKAVNSRVVSIIRCMYIHIENKCRDRRYEKGRTTRARQEKMKIVTDAIDTSSTSRFTAITSCA